MVREERPEARGAALISPTAVYLNPHDPAAWHHLGLRQASRPLDEPRADRRGRARGPGPEARRPALGAAASEVGCASWRVERRRADAEAKLAEISDPRAVPSITRLFAGSFAGLPEDGRAAPRSDRRARRHRRSWRPWRSTATTQAYARPRPWRSKGAARAISPVILSTGSIRR